MITREPLGKRALFGLGARHARRRGLAACMHSGESPLELSGSELLLVLLLLPLLLQLLQLLQLLPPRLLLLRLLLCLLQRRPG